MPTTPAALLSLSARLFGSTQGQAVLRRAFLTLFERPLPMGGVEAMAARMPDRGAGQGAAPMHSDEQTVAPSGSGVLDGEYVAVKDSLDVAGLPTLLGMPGDSLSADHHRVERDAVLVARVRRAGGIIRGKARMTELGMDGIGALMPGEMPENAVVPGYIAGGSSTGTAIAVAQGLARYGIGGDGLGSVRIPAAFQGLVGLKPGRGVLSHEGYRSVAPSMDVPGPIARNVADCLRLYQVLADLPVSALPARVPARVGLIAGLGPELAAADQRRAFHRLLDALSVPRRLVQVPGASTHVSLAVAASTAELATSEYAARTRSGQGLLNIAIGRSMANDGPLLAKRRAQLTAALMAALKEVEVLAMPTTAIPAPASHHGLRARGQDILLLRAIGAYTPMANLSGLPAITVPSGRDARGRPLGLMLMGRPDSELALLQMAAALEAAGLGTTPI